MNGLDFLLDPPAQRFSDWSWATVTSVDPVHIRLDGDTAPLAVPPTLLVPEAELEVDTRVRVHMDKSNALGQVGARIYVIGVAGGGGAAITGSRNISGNSGGTGGWAIRIGPVLICAVRVTLYPVADQVTGVTWTFPELFSSPPVVTSTVSTGANTVSRNMVSDPTVSSVTLSVVRSNTTNTTIYATAVGPAA